MQWSSGFKKLTEFGFALVCWLECSTVLQYCTSFSTLKFVYCILKQLVPVYFISYYKLHLIQLSLLGFGITIYLQKLFVPKYGKVSSKYLCLSEYSKFNDHDLFSMSLTLFKSKCQDYFLSLQFNERCVLPNDCVFCDLSCIDDVISSLTT